MLLSLLFTICYSSLSSNEKNAYADQRPASFSFSTGPKRQFTLSGPQLNTETSKTSPNSAKRFLKSKQESQWYYIHPIDDDLHILQKYVNIRPDDEIIKNTFVLYLTPNQLENILPHAYIKLLEPMDKLEIIHPIKDIDSFSVIVAPNYNLPADSPLYTITRRNGDDTYIIKVNSNGLNDKEFNVMKQKVAQVLSGIPGVKKVTTYSKPALQNHINIGYVQKNLQQFRRDDYSKLIIFDRYVHKHGLTGESEVITIEDSPIDFRHPMFRDDKVQVEFNKDMPNHRKFLYYKWDEDMDAWLKNLNQEEHGTHTAGTLAGKSIVSDPSHSISQLFDGTAPDAKLIYAGLYDNLTAQELEDVMNSHGSRVSSNSWGDSAKYVDELNYKYGTLALKNPQSIFIFAAGNYAISGTFSVIDPSGSKNVLCVGAASNPLLKNQQEFSIQSDTDDSILIFGNFATDLKDFEFTSDFLGTPDNQSDFVAVNYKTEDEGGNDTIACEQMNGPYVALFYGENFEAISNFVSFCQAPLSKGRFITDDVAGVEKLLKSGSKMRVRMNGNPTEVNEIKKLSVSSVGPGNKGIMKPDVSAPGENIISAKSYLANSSFICKDINDGCGLVFKYGTSMSTPIVAGGATLISQYFKSGKWIEKTELDGATLRALLINSARHPKGEKTPETFLGHGVVDLSSVLPLENDFGVQIPRQQTLPSVNENGHVTAKIDVKSAKVELQITMSYLDVMLEMSSPIPLTRDLDLVVVSPDGEIFKGDHLNDGDTQHFSTNEKVIIRKNELKVGTYTVHVFGNKFLDSKLKDAETVKQNFSVVATGDIDNKYIEFVDSTESPCKEADESHPGYCKCKSDEIGPVCQAKVIQGKLNEKIDVELEPRTLYRVQFTSDKLLDTLTFYADYYVATNAQLWLSQTCHLTPHQYESVENFVIYEEFAKTVNISDHVGKKTPELCVMIFANSDIKHQYHIMVNTSDVQAPTIEPTKEPTSEPTKEPTSEPTKEPTSEPTKEPTSEPTQNPQPSNDSEDSNGKKKRSKMLLILFIVACALGVAIIVSIIVIVVLCVKSKSGYAKMSMKSENLSSSEPLRSPLLF